VTFDGSLRTPQLEATVAELCAAMEAAPIAPPHSPRSFAFALCKIDAFAPDADTAHTMLPDDHHVKAQADAKMKEVLVLERQLNALVPGPGKDKQARGRLIRMRLRQACWELLPLQHLELLLARRPLAQRLQRDLVALLHRLAPPTGPYPGPVMGGLMRAATSGAVFALDPEASRCREEETVPGGKDGGKNANQLTIASMKRNNKLGG
jgi:hypothetical protein